MRHLIALFVLTLIVVPAMAETPDIDMAWETPDIIWVYHSNMQYVCDAVSISSLDKDNINSDLRSECLASVNQDGDAIPHHVVNRLWRHAYCRLLKSSVIASNEAGYDCDDVTAKVGEEAAPEEEEPTTIGQVFSLAPPSEEAEKETEVLTVEESTDSWNVDFSGYSQEAYNSETADFNNDRTRLRFRLASEGSCEYFAEFDVSGASRSSDELRESNWLQQVWSRCQLSNETQVTFGRVFPESGFSTFWPGGIITARYPGMYPWAGYYAYGLSIKRSAGAWSYSGTVSGRSDLQFDDPLDEQFSRLEFAGRAVRSFGENAQVGMTTQVSEDFFHTGLDFGRDFDNTKIDGAVFYSDVDDTPISGFVQVEQVLTGHFALHGLAEERVSGDEVGTVGVGVRWKEFYLVGDYEMNFDTNSDSYLAGLRYNW